MGLVRRGCGRQGSPISDAYGPVYARKDYAGFIRRSLALAIDFLLLATFWVISLWGWSFLAPCPWVTERAYAWSYLILLLFSVVYLLGMRLTMRGTLGYRLMRIRYAYMLDQSPGMVMILFRGVAALGLMWIFALDHLWILFDEQKQSWHDKLTGFYVVKSRAQPVGKVRVQRRLVGVMGYSFLVWEPVVTEVSQETVIETNPGEGLSGCAQRESRGLGD